MMLGLTPFFLLCPSLGKAQLHNMLADSIAYMRARRRFKFMIMQIWEFLNSKRCLIEDVKDMKL
jgi:hypothetical protein